MIKLYTIIYQGDVKGSTKISERLFFKAEDANDWGSSTTNDSQTYTVVELIPVEVEEKKIAAITSEPKSFWTKLTELFQ